LGGQADKAKPVATNCCVFRVKDRKISKHARL
jgi:hypothetical protein